MTMEPEHGRNILEGVVNVGYHGLTGDNRFPEDLPFPGCLTSLIEYLKPDAFPKVEFKINGETRIERRGNSEFVAASGMGFGILFADDWSPNMLDFTLVSKHADTVRGAMNAAGFSYLSLAQIDTPREEMKMAIIKAIDEGKPVLAFLPECALITGYDKKGDVMIGWAYNQPDAPWAKEDNGMYRDGDWYEHTMKVVIPDKELPHRSDFFTTLFWGCEVMTRTEINGMFAGCEAYNHWIRAVLDPEIETWDDEILQSRHSIHHALVGTLAEARWWLHHYLLRHSSHYEIKMAAENAANIHKKAWDVWAALDAVSAGPYLHLNFKDPKRREHIAALLTEMQYEDAQMLNHIQNALSDRRFRGK